MATYTLALINNHEDGKIFFDTYNIPYQVITKGTNAGKLRVRQPRSYDSTKYAGCLQNRVMESFVITVTCSVMRMTGLQSWRRTG